jgi:hypothetical protein
LPTSYTIPFLIFRGEGGGYGIVLRVSLPRFFGRWGYVTAIDLTISRRYRFKGKRRSFLSAGCPAPKGFRVVSFSFARASFVFEDGKRLSTTLNRSCRVRR